MCIWYILSCVIHLYCLLFYSLWPGAGFSHGISARRCLKKARKPRNYNNIRKALTHTTRNIRIKCTACDGISYGISLAETIFSNLCCFFFSLPFTLPLLLCSIQFTYSSWQHALHNSVICLLFGGQQKGPAYNESIKYTQIEPTSYCASASYVYIIYSMCDMCGVGTKEEEKKMSLCQQRKLVSIN